MIDTQNHVRAHTPTTPAQRRAGRIADATVLANKTFGWAAIAALDGEWVADDEMAELRFTREGIACRLWYAAAGATWIVGCDAMNEAYVVMAGVETSPTLAAYRLGVVVGALWRAIQDANEVEV